jgi:hypothetical protein
MSGSPRHKMMINVKQIGIVLKANGIVKLGLRFTFCL